jgi:hypothetical protein
MTKAKANLTWTSQGCPGLDIRTTLAVGAVRLDGRSFAVTPH